MNRLIYFIAAPLLLLCLGCNGRKNTPSPAQDAVNELSATPPMEEIANEEPSAETADTTAAQITTDDIFALPVLSYEDSLREATLNDLFWQKELTRGDAETFAQKADSVMAAYLTHSRTLSLPVDTLHTERYARFQADTFRINEKRRFLEQHLFSSSDMILISQVNRVDHQAMWNDYIREMAGLSITPALDMAVTRELELWESLTEHENASSENILLGEYLVGDMNEVLQAGIMADNALIRGNSTASLFFAIAGEEVPTQKVRQIQDSIYLTRKEIRKAYRKIRPFISENDGLVLEEEESLFNAMIEQRLKIIQMLPSKSHMMLKRDLLAILQNKADHLVFYRDELSPTLPGVDEEALND